MHSSDPVNMVYVHTQNKYEIVLKEGSGLLGKKEADGKNKHRQSDVPCPKQDQDYSDTFHQIDKSNSAKDTCELGGQSKSHI